MEGDIKLAITENGEAIFDAEVTQKGDAIEILKADGKRITLYPPVINKIAMEEAKMICVRTATRVFGEIRNQDDRLD